MIRFINQKGFKMSFYRNILVNDPCPFDVLITDIPANGLQKDVSDLLQIPYLSKYEGSKEELLKMRQYKGAIIGDLSRIFFSIPTARSNSQEFYYVHYLLDTGSPHTTLTHQVLCCLFGKKTDEHNNIFPSRMNILIGGIVVETHLSNPDPTDKNPSYNYHNVNLLGQNFMRQYKICKLEQNFKTRKAILELME